MNISCSGRCPVIVNDNIYQKTGNRACCRELYRNTNRCNLHQRGSYSVVDASTLQKQTIALDEKINYENFANLYNQKTLQRRSQEEKLKQTEDLLKNAEIEYQNLQGLQGKLRTAYDQLLQDQQTSKREKSILQNEITDGKEQLEQTRRKMDIEISTLQNKIGELRKKLTEENLLCKENLNEQEDQFLELRKKYIQEAKKKIRQKDRTIKQVEDNLTKSQEESKRCQADLDNCEKFFNQAQDFLERYGELWDSDQFQNAKYNKMILEKIGNQTLAESQNSFVTDVIGNRFYRYTLDDKSFWVLEDRRDGKALISTSSGENRMIYGTVGENVQNDFVRTYVINDGGRAEPVQLFSGTYVHPFFLPNNVGPMEIGYIALENRTGEFLRLSNGTPIFVDSKGEYYVNDTFTLLVDAIEKKQITDGIQNLDFTKSKFLPLFLYKAINRVLNKAESDAISYLDQGQLGQLIGDQSSSRKRRRTSTSS